LNSFSKPTTVEGFIDLFLYCAVAGLVIWWSEKGNPEFDDDLRKGYPDALEHALVTSSSTGYGHRVAKKPLGRWVQALTIIIGIAFFGNFCGLLAADYTAEKMGSSIGSVEDLRGKKVCALDGTTTVPFLRKLGISVTPVTEEDGGIAEARELVLNGDMDAFVTDSPIVLEIVKEDGRFASPGGMFDAQKYGFALQKGSPLKEDIKMALLQLMESGRYAEIVDKWLGKS